jgi:hypothetical protein
MCDTPLDTAPKMLKSNKLPSTREVPSRKEAAPVALANHCMSKWHYRMQHPSGSIPIHISAFFGHICTRAMCRVSFRANQYIFVGLVTIRTRCFFQQHKSPLIPQENRLTIMQNIYNTSYSRTKVPCVHHLRCIHACYQQGFLSLSPSGCSATLQSVITSVS